MNIYILTITNYYGIVRKATVKARSRLEAIEKVYKSDGEFVTECVELD